MTTDKPNHIRAGLFGIGLDTYWPQFKGLLPRLTGYQERIATRLRGFGVSLTDAGMVDTPAKAQAAASLFRREEVDIVFLYISTYALSSTVLPVVQKAGVPVVVHIVVHVLIRVAVIIRRREFIAAKTSFCAC